MERVKKKKNPEILKFNENFFVKGQHELNLKYSDALGMADIHTLYKQCFKEVADQQG
jgi:glutamine synthetase